MSSDRAAKEASERNIHHVEYSRAKMPGDESGAACTLWKKTSAGHKGRTPSRYLLTLCNEELRRESETASL